MPCNGPGGANAPPAERACLQLIVESQLGVGAFGETRSHSATTSGGGQHRFGVELSKFGQRCVQILDTSISQVVAPPAATEAPFSIAEVPRPQTEPPYTEMKEHFLAPRSLIGPRRCRSGNGRSGVPHGGGVTGAGGAGRRAEAPSGEKKPPDSGKMERSWPRRRRHLGRRLGTPRGGACDPRGAAVIGAEAPASDSKALAAEPMERVGRAIGPFAARRRSRLAREGVWRAREGRKCGIHRVGTLPSPRHIPDPVISRTAGSQLDATRAVVDI